MLSVAWSNGSSSPAHSSTSPARLAASLPTWNITPSVSWELPVTVLTVKLREPYSKPSSTTAPMLGLAATEKPRPPPLSSPIVSVVSQTCGGSVLLVTASSSNAAASRPDSSWIGFVPGTS